MSKSLFPLGRCVITPGAKETLETLGVEPIALLLRHQSGDWAEMSRHDQTANRDAVRDDSRVFSSYRVGSNAVPILVITEADRSSTTILLSKEY